jgi:hypothetical protein
MLLPVWCVVFVLASSFQATDTLPDRLSDTVFWQLVTDASELSGSFISENFVSNELGYQYVIPPALERVPRGGVYMGVGPEQNFTYIAAFRPSIAFIVDIRRQNLVEHLLYKALFEMSGDRVEFLSRLFARRPASVDGNTTIEGLFAGFAGVPMDPDLRRDTLQAVKERLQMQHGFGLSEEDSKTLEHVYGEFAREGSEIRYSVATIPRVITLPELPNPDGTNANPADPNATPLPPQLPLPVAAVTLFLGMPFPTYAEVMNATDALGMNWSFLATEENYRIVREMQQRNLIVPVVGDFSGPQAIRTIGQFLKDHDTTVSVFYVSNVEQYLTPPPKLQDFYANVATLPLNPSSTFIRSAQTRGSQPGLAQSAISSMQTVLDAVLEGRARTWSDIYRLSDR